MMHRKKCRQHSSCQNTGGGWPNPNSWSHPGADWIANLHNTQNTQTRPSSQEEKCQVCPCPTHTPPLATEIRDISEHAKDHQAKAKCAQEDRDDGRNLDLSIWSPVQTAEFSVAGKRHAPPIEATKTESCRQMHADHFFWLEGDDLPWICAQHHDQHTALHPDLGKVCSCTQEETPQTVQISSYGQCKPAHIKRHTPSHVVHKNEDHWAPPLLTRSSALGLLAVSKTEEGFEGP